MHGAIADSLIASFKRAGARKGGVHEPGMRYVELYQGSPDAFGVTRIRRVEQNQQNLVITPCG